MSPRPTSTSWLASVGVALTMLTLGWGVATQWFALQQRVHDLEREQNFLHGPIDLPKEAK